LIENLGGEKMIIAIRKKKKKKTETQKFVLNQKKGVLPAMLIRRGREKRLCLISQ